MQRKMWWRLALALALVLLVAIPVWADDGDEGTVRFGEDLVIAPGERVRGDAVVFGADALVEPGGLVTGDLAVMGGSATIRGEVLGAVVVFGGNANLEEGCQVSGDVVTFGGEVHRAPGARVQGQVLSGFRWAPFSGWFWSWAGQAGEPGAQRPPLSWAEAFVAGLVGLLRGIVGALISALLLAGLAILAMLFLPQHTRQIAACVETAWPASLGVGILAVLVAVVVALVLVATLCLAPLGLLLLVAVAAAWILGLIAIGLLIGERLFQALNQADVSPLWQAAAGVALLILVSNAPCIGWAIGLAAGCIG
ncbi:MAG: hypothetical protein H5T59_08730, partial [Anaerolineae bacterium]|nr:hypothetical protein [Anaerolineae bacterium]